MAKLAIVYFSGSGNTEKMANLIAEGAKKAGADVQTVKASSSMDVAKIAQADAFALGSPDYFSYVAGELKIFFDRAYAQSMPMKDKPYVAFGSHGGGGQVVKCIDKLAQSLKMKQAAEGVLVQGAPTTAADVDACKKLGGAVAAAAMKK